jgi:hypothetical protein
VDSRGLLEERLAQAEIALLAEQAAAAAAEPKTPTVMEAVAGHAAAWSQMAQAYRGVEQRPSRVLTRWGAAAQEQESARARAEQEAGLRPRGRVQTELTPEQRRAADAARKQQTRAIAKARSAPASLAARRSQRIARRASLPASSRSFWGRRATACTYHTLGHDLGPYTHTIRRPAARDVSWLRIA